MPPAAEMMCAPFEPAARYTSKRQTTWTGYKVHVTESCGAAEPHVLTHSITTEATEQATEVVDDCHHVRAQQGLSPAEHVLGQG